MNATFLRYGWFFLLLFGNFSAPRFGFFGHRKINELAIYALPPEMSGWYKVHAPEIIERATLADKRRYSVEGEAPRHYIDLDDYMDSTQHALPKYWSTAKQVFHPDTLMKRGIVPWHIYSEYHRLRRAFEEKNETQIVKVSADLGHYIADAHVPLHTSKNHDGQYTNQVGIHGFWESRLPSLFFAQYDFYVGKADYIADVQQRAWDVVWDTHGKVDSVLHIEKKIFEQMGEEKYQFAVQGKQTIKVISENYARRYHDALNGMVERQMRRAVKMVADVWYTAWVDAGQPDMRLLHEKIEADPPEDTSPDKKIKTREHETE